MQYQKIIIDAPGGPENLRLETCTLSAPAKGQVRVRHHAIGVNFIDTYHRSGLYPLRLPSGLGLEAAGQVDAVGEGVTGIKAGDRVAYCSGPVGAYAEYHSVAAGSLILVPEQLDLEIIAASLLKGMTAAYLLLKTADLKPGDVILVHAAAGGVGQMLCRWAKHLHLTVVATVGREHKRATAEALGCDLVINYRREDWVAEVKAYTGGKGVDVVYDGVGKDTFSGSLACLRSRGLMVSFGNASGAVDAFSPLELARSGSLFLTRPTLADYVRDPAEFRALGAALMDVLVKGVLCPDIHARLPLSRAADAHRMLESGETMGSIVLVPELL